MEAAPPTYEAATVINPWELVARFFNRSDLLAAVRVCRSWHTIFTPRLWGNPAAQSREFFDANSFLLSLPKVRPTVRHSIHTFYLPISRSHEGLRRGWLRNLLTRLDRLQALIVRSQSCFDHDALVALNQVQTSSLRLLDASNCRNATPTGLADALKKMHQLLYLDLSGTYAARDHRVLSQLSRIVGLRVLKLRSISLNDADFQTLAACIQTRVRSLDLRQNKLSDASARRLVESCFPINERSDTPKMQHAFEGSGFESLLRRSLTSDFSLRLALEDGPDRGITHLYISENRFSSIGLSILLQKNQIRVLDVGVQKPLFGIETAGNNPPASRPTSLTVLRADYRLITGEQLSFESRPEEIRERSSGSYHIGMTKALQTLILSGFPSHSRDSKAVHDLIAFVQLCGIESQTAMKEASSLTWSLPPGRRSAQDRNTIARQLFALETIVLEVASPAIPAVRRTLSAVDDEDTENFWRAAEGDFSFFDNEAEDSEEDQSLSKTSTNASLEQSVDNIDILAAFRKDRKLAYELAVSNAKDGSDVEVRGYWPGTVRVRTISNAEWTRECYNAETEDYQCRTRHTHRLDRLG